MANKTIHELSSIANLSSSDELAIYDVSGSVTGNGTIEGILGTNITGLDTTATNLIDAINQHEDTLSQKDLLYADDEEEPTGEVEFVSQDTSLTPSSTVSVDLLNGNNSWSQRFVKISQMFKNIRYLLGKTKTINDKFGNIDNLISDFNNDTFFKSKYSQQTSMMVLPFATTTTNQPGTSSWGYCLLYFGESADYFKIYYLNAVDEVYTRTYSNDSWGDWVQQISNKVILGDSSAITAGSGITLTLKQSLRAGNVVFINVTAHKTDETVFTGRINPLFTISDARFRARAPFNAVAATNASINGLTTGIANIYVGGNSVDMVLMDTFTANQKEVRVTLCYITY